VGAAKRSICGFMGIPPQVAAIETSGRYFAKSSRFLKICPNSLVGTKTSACIEDELVSINCKRGNQKQLFFLYQFLQVQLGQLCLLKVAELLLLNFCGFNNFQLSCFLELAEILNQRIVWHFFGCYFIKNSCFCMLESSPDGTASCCGGVHHNRYSR
jgi:hypothetical protein